MIRAYVHEDFAGMFLAVTFIREGDGGFNSPRPV